MSKIFELHDLVINSESRTVRKGGETLKLHDLTYELLLGLVSSAPEPLNLDSLAERVWKAPHVSNDTVAQRIALLRKALGDDPKEPKYIRTVRGSGYGVIGPVRVLNEAPPAMPSKPRLPFAMVLGFALAVLTLGASVFWLWSTQTQEAEMQDETLEVDERSPNAVLIERAQAQLSLHQPKETQRALVMLRTAVEREPDSFDARLALALALVTSATKFQGDIDEKNEAEAIARDLTETHPENSDAWSALGYSLSSLGRGDEALAAYRQSIALGPTNASARSSAAHLLLLKGDLQQALLLDWEARARGGNSKYSEIQIAQALELIGHPAAAAWQEQALTLNPGQTVVVKEAALSKLRAGDPQAALDLIATYDSETSTSPQLLTVKGRVLLVLGLEQEARAALRDAGWRGDFLLAALAGREGDQAEVEKRFSVDERLDLSGTLEPDLLVQLAEVEASLGEVEKSAQMISVAVARGWRDARWLEVSPFLAKVLNDRRGRASIERIKRELNAQRNLIQETKELQSILDGPSP